MSPAALARVAGAWSPRHVAGAELAETAGRHLRPRPGAQRHELLVGTAHIVDVVAVGQRVGRLVPVAAGLPVGGQTADVAGEDEQQ